MKPNKHYVIRVPCEVCPEGHHDRYAAANWTPWSSEKGARRRFEPANERRAVGDADLARLEGRNGAVNGRADLELAWPPGPQSDAWAGISERYWPATPQPTVRAVVDGLARSDLLRIYGNGVVPQQAAAAFQELWEALTSSA